ncbi:hypothetical protein [Escherichia coli IS5]|nr:hypothetical protein [Shigella sonnei]UWA27673.1 hypothetical protein M5S53_25910 [Escherichia coli O25b:H4-ST131]CDK51536.1 hypothetical protein [Escherichia coli IS5]
MWITIAPFVTINLLIIVLRAVVAVANAVIAILELIRELVD